MPVNPSNPLVVQSDKSVLLEVDNPQYAEARDALARFAELEKSPEHIHTYRLSPLSLWNAAASGLTSASILDTLTRYSKYDVPSNIQADVKDYVSRFGRLKLRRDDRGGLILTAEDPLLMLEVSRQRKLKQFIIEEVDAAHGARQPGYARPRQESVGGYRLSGRGPRRLRGRRAADLPPPACHATERRSLAPARLPE